MLLNYIKISFRLLARSPFFTFINISGLSVGFAVFFILWPFTQSELESDQFVKDFKKIVRPIEDFEWTDDGGANWGHLNIAVTGSNLAPQLRRFDEVEDVTRYIPQSFFWPSVTHQLREELVAKVNGHGESEKIIKIETAICADQNFFEFFGFPFIEGEGTKALKEVTSVALSERVSKNLFGGERALGKTLRVNQTDFLVTGVFKDIPANSHFRFDYVFSNVAVLDTWDARLDLWLFQYYKMKGDPARMAEIVNENKELLLGDFLKKNPHVRLHYSAQPLSEVAFSQGYSADVFKAKSRLTLRMLAGVSIVVLLMAWMNYVNLTVAQSRTRLKEIAARKVSGALIRDLFLQFCCQSAVVNVLAVAVGLTIIQIIRVPFEQLLNIQIVSFENLKVETLALFSSILLTGILVTSGYTAWVTSRHSARRLLANDVPVGKQSLSLFLTTTQYAAALCMIASVFVMNDQLEFILNKDLGVDRENILIVDSPVLGLEGKKRGGTALFAGMLRSESTVKNATVSSKICGDVPLSIELRRQGSEIHFGLDSQGGIDEGFIPTFDLKLLAGRNFLKDEPKPCVIISRLASQRLGFKTPNEAVGAFVEGTVSFESQTHEIIGVIEDYRTTPWLMSEGSSEAVTGRGQALFYYDLIHPGYIPAKISIKVGNTRPEVISRIENLYHETFPGNVFNWFYLDDNINRQYGDQRVARNQIIVFTLLAIGVACLGLLGMISNKLSEKVKEISVRKILGAQTHHILKVLLGSTGIQVCIALVIGTPVAWRISRAYLQNYTEQIAIQWWHLAVPVFILVLLMIMTVSSVLWKAARNNPVDSLKHE